MLLAANGTCNSVGIILLTRVCFMGIGFRETTQGMRIPFLTPTELVLHPGFYLSNNRNTYQIILLFFSFVLNIHDTATVI